MAIFLQGIIENYGCRVFAVFRGSISDVFTCSLCRKLRSFAVSKPDDASGLCREEGTAPW